MQALALLLLASPAPVAGDIAQKTLHEPLAPTSNLAFGDVDGDGAPDAIVALAGAEGDAVAVYWNKQGELSADDVEKIHIEGFASLLDAAPIRVSDSGVSAIAILQTGALLLATANRGRAIDPPTPVLTHDDGVGLVIGDVDSDGVDDILVRIGNKLRVMRQLPAPPVGATALDAGDGAR